MDKPTHFDEAAVKDMNKGVVEEFRAHGGKVGGPFQGAPLLLLTTTGAKTGNRHTIPLVYGKDGDRILVFGSKAGSPEHPTWFTNMVANPAITVEVGTEKYEARAVVLQGEERDRLFNEQAARMPQFAEYAKNTTRVIPVIALERV